MKYFVISDIHGYYNVMISSLEKSGYNPSNPNHHLIVCGDMFDRGSNSKDVFEYLYNLNQLKKATVIIGNHDIFLRDFLEEKYDKVAFNVKYNGHETTIKSFSGCNMNEHDYPFLRNTIMEKYPNLLSWLQNLPYYLELDDYIFVHGGIDGKMLDWKTMSTPRDFVWSREIDLEPIYGKTVVAGHHRVATIRKKTTDYHRLYLEEPSLFDILYDQGKILIDRFVEVSQELNVLILDIDG